MLVEIQGLQRRKPDATETARLDGEIARLRAELAEVKRERDEARRTLVGAMQALEHARG